MNHEQAARCGPREGEPCLRPDVRLTLRDAAAILAISPRTLRSWVAAGCIPAERSDAGGEELCFSPEALAGYCLHRLLSEEDAQDPPAVLTIPEEWLRQVTDRQTALVTELSWLRSALQRVSLEL